MPIETKTNNGAVKTPAGTPPARITDGLTGPITGPAGEAVLEKAISRVFPTESAEEEITADRTAPNVPAPGGKGTQPAEQNPPEHADDEGQETPEEKAAREEQEQADLAERAKASGKTVEQQKAAEDAELARLQEIMDRTGETIEEIYDREDKGEAEPEGEEKTGKTYTQEQVEELIQKRLKNATAEVADLRRQLEAKEQARPATGNVLDKITSIEKLSEVAESAQARLEDGDRMLRQLNYAPKRVEQYFRDLAGKHPEVANLFQANGEEDFSVERMADVLEGQMEVERQTLRAVPAREKFLKASVGAHEQAVKIHPWLSKPEDRRSVIFKALEQSPLGQLAKVRTPNWEYWIGNAAAYQALLETHAKKAGAARPGAARTGKVQLRVKFPGTGSRGGTPPPRINGDRIKSAKDKLRQNPTEEGLEKFFEAII